MKREQKIQQQIIVYRCKRGGRQEEENKGWEEHKAERKNLKDGGRWCTVTKNIVQGKNWSGLTKISSQNWSPTAKYGLYARASFTSTVSIEAQ